MLSYIGSVWECLQPSRQNDGYQTRGKKKPVGGGIYAALLSATAAEKLTIAALNVITKKRQKRRTASACDQGTREDQ
jgi:hypothetical protein